MSPSDRSVWVAPCCVVTPFCPTARLHEAAGLISMEGSLEGLPEQQAAPHKRPAVMEEDAAAKSAKKKAKKAAKAKAAKGEL